MEVTGRPFISSNRVSDSTSWLELLSSFVDSCSVSAMHSFCWYSGKMYERIVPFSFCKTVPRSSIGVQMIPDVREKFRHAPLV